MSFVKMRLEAGAEIEDHDNKGWTALFYAARGGRADVVKYLLQKKANPHLIDTEGNTCLHIASDRCRGLECVKLLVEYKIAVNCQNQKKETPLHFAVYSWDGDDKIVDYLLENYADPNSKNVDDETSLHYAAKDTQNMDLVKLLVEKNADVNAKNKKGESPLHLAAIERVVRIWLLTCLK